MAGRPKFDNARNQFLLLIICAKKVTSLKKEAASLFRRSNFFSYDMTFVNDRKIHEVGYRVCTIVHVKNYSCEFTLQELNCTFISRVSMI